MLKVKSEFLYLKAQINHSDTEAQRFHRENDRLLSNLRVAEVKKYP